MEWLNFRHLYAFWAVCRYGGFHKAAERIFVSQSTVSEQVAQLEAYFEEELLERSTRSVTVTDRGAALLAYADEIFARSYEINHIFRDKHESLLSSTIRIGMVGGISRNFVFRRIMSSLDGPQRSRVEVIDGSFDELDALLRGFELDLIFSLDRPRQKDLVTVSHQRIATSPICLAGTPALVQRLQQAPWPEDTPLELYLFRYPFEGPPLPEVIAAQLGVGVHVPVLTDDISLLRFLANTGRGLAVLPEIGVKEDLAAGRVVQLPLDGERQIDVFAIYLTRGVRRRLIDAFLT